MSIDGPPSDDLEEIRAATVGELRRLDGPILLVDYHPSWPGLFAREAARVRTALSDGALRIEHVGSTAVPGLVAKPIIDMVLVVADSADEEAYVLVLEAAGSVLRIREPGWHEHRMFKGPDTDINLHVFSAGCAEIQRMLIFRAWLRHSDADRDLYARAKRVLVLLCQIVGNARETRAFAFRTPSALSSLAMAVKCGESSVLASSLGESSI